MPPVTRESAEAPLALAVDVGSSSVRAAVFDRLGRRVEGLGARVPYAMYTTPDGGVVVNDLALVALVVRAVDEVLAAAGSHADNIGCVGVASFWHSLVGVSADGEAVTPVITWADTRSRHAADRLRRELDEAAVHARTGAVLHASYLPAKLAWLRDTDRAAFDRAARWMSFAELLYLRLFGRPACSVSMASATGLFDQKARRWDDEVGSAVGIRLEQLSEVSDDPCSGLLPSYAARWPALAGVPWRPALGDGACANVGSGCVTPSRVALTLGTSGAMRVVCAEGDVEPPRGLWAYRLDARRPVVGGALSEGGGLFAWLTRLLRVEPGPALEAELASAEPDGHGLTILPFVAGERSPGWATDARAAVAGLSLDTEPVDILRAALESVAYRFTLIAERLAAFVPADAEVVGSGAALLRSRAWAQIMADVLGRPVVLSAEEEASSRGAALMALEAAGAIDDLSSIPSERGRVFEPDAGRHERYRRALDRQRALYDALITGT
jgi:gluconokinase